MHGGGGMAELLEALQSGLGHPAERFIKGSGSGGRRRDDGSDHGLHWGRKLSDQHHERQAALRVGPAYTYSDNDGAVSL